jgi:hypothetical protein
MLLPLTLPNGIRILGRAQPLRTPQYPWQGVFATPLTGTSPLCNGPRGEVATFRIAAMSGRFVGLGEEVFDGSCRRLRHCGLHGRQPTTQPRRPLGRDDPLIAANDGRCPMIGKPSPKP